MQIDLLLAAAIIGVGVSAVLGIGAVLVALIVALFRHRGGVRP